MELRELVRRLYVDLVRGRTRVRVVNAADTTAGSTPRFLLSPYRSGTTLLRHCLDSHPHLAVPPETDFFAPLLATVDDEQSMAGLGDLGYSRAQVAGSLGSYGRSFLDTYAAGKGVECWLDKSPRYAENPAQLGEAFPGARLVMMHRHPLDQIHSISRGGTEVFHAMKRIMDRSCSGRELILESGRYWARVTQRLLDFQDDNPESVCTVRYEDLCRRPTNTLGTILDHLELSWSDDVLDFHRFDHDQGRESTRVAGTKGFSLSSGAWQDWPPEWLESVWPEVQPQAERLGYARVPEAG